MPTSSISDSSPPGTLAAEPLHSPPASGSPAISPLRQKRQLRRDLRQRRRSLTPRQQREAANAAARRMEACPWMWRAGSVAAYWPADGEMDPRPLLKRARARRKAVYLPVLMPGNRLYFRRWRPGEAMRPNRYGIPEPQTGRLRQAWTLALIILPLVGFDRRGTRLGMGGGFYDRTLARTAARFSGRQPLLLGLAHACQEVAELPSDPWDRPLDAIITDREWIVAAGSSDQDLDAREP